MTPPRPHPVLRRVLRWVMIVFYAGAAYVHLTAPSAFLPIVPAWVPYPTTVVLLTGLCELFGAAGLGIPRWRRWAGIMLALYAVCVFPANIKHAFEGIDVPQLPHSWWYHGPRLLAQPILVWWALFCADVVDWPFRGRDPAGHEKRHTAAG